MQTLRQKWGNIIKEYEHVQRVKDDQYPSIPWVRRAERGVERFLWVQRRGNTHRPGGLMQE